MTDLRQEDFEVLEAGAPQKIEQFERVLIQGNLPQEMRREPNSVEAGRQAAQNPRARIRRLSRCESRRRRRLAQHPPAAGRSAQSLIGPEDVFAVMTPDMSAGGITFPRRTTTIEGELSKYWTWGQRDRLISKDPEEEQYKSCFPNIGDTVGIADRMIERRREDRR